MPLSTPLTLRNGTSTTSIHVPKGTAIMVGIYSSNRNKAIWGDDACEWKPERWFEGKLPDSVTDAKIPGVYSNLWDLLNLSAIISLLKRAQDDLHRWRSCMHVRLQIIFANKSTRAYFPIRSGFKLSQLEMSGYPILSIIHC